MSTGKAVRTSAPTVPLPPIPGHNTTTQVAESRLRLVAWTGTPADSAAPAGGLRERTAVAGGGAWGPAGLVAAVLVEAVVASVVAVFGAEVGPLCCERTERRTPGSWRNQYVSPYLQT